MNKEIIMFLRKSYNLTQRDFARLVNCSFALIALIEVGKRSVSAKLEDKIKFEFELDQNQIDSILAIIKTVKDGVSPFL